MSLATVPSPQTIPYSDLIEAAVLAPSPDNNQPWRFVRRDDQLSIYLDPQRALPSDVNGMFDLMGLGAAIENICIAARQAGYEPCVDYGNWPAASVRDALQPAATMTFTPGGDADPLFAHLATRCTCRRLYSTQQVAEASLQKMTEAAQYLPEVQLDWITDRRRIRALARLVAASDRIRFEYEPFHNELFRQLRFSVEDAERTRDGLDIRTLELPPGAAGMLRHLQSWNRMKWVHRLGLGRLLTLPSALSVCKSGALGVLSVPELTTRQSLQGGRALQRIWLTAQAEGLALQPIGSLSIFFAHVEQLHGQKLCRRHHLTIQLLIERFRQLVPSTNGFVLLLAFRLGSSAPPSHRSLRRPPNQVFMKV